MSELLRQQKDWQAVEMEATEACRETTGPLLSPIPWGYLCLCVGLGRRGPPRGRTASSPPLNQSALLSAQASSCHDSGGSHSRLCPHLASECCTEPATFSFFKKNLFICLLIYLLCVCVPVYMCSCMCGHQPQGDLVSSFLCSSKGSAEQTISTAWPLPDFHPQLTRRKP